MKIIFGSFRNAARDEKLIDSTIGRKGGAYEAQQLLNET
jgi:hypothetical protein